MILAKLLQPLVFNNPYNSDHCYSDHYYSDLYYSDHFYSDLYFLCHPLIDLSPYSLKTTQRNVILASTTDNFRIYKTSFHT